MGEGLSLGESRDTTFVLTGVGTWVGKPAYLATDPLTIQEGHQESAQAITECQIKARGPGCQCVKTVEPTTIQIQPSRRFSPKGHPWRCQFRPSIIASPASKRLKLQLI